jgi:hypothetical protein
LSHIGLKSIVLQGGDAACKPQNGTSRRAELE